MHEGRQIRKLIQLALEEDLGMGDITSELTIADNHRSRAAIVARERLIFCEARMIEAIFEELGWKVEVELLVKDGAEEAPGTVLARLAGKTRELLATERIILNFLQRLSGIATYTREFLRHAGALTVMDTRKTTPGWRMLEKYAVRTGGARNHRASLGDMILVKNNHIAANGGNLAATLKGVLDKKPLYMPVEVEVQTCAELEQVMDLGINIVMLDNFKDEDLARALDLLKAKKPNLHVEVSGGIRTERLAALGSLGVECVSVGSLTSQATCVDISMRIEQA